MVFNEQHQRQNFHHTALHLRRRVVVEQLFNHPPQTPRVARAHQKSVDVDGQQGALRKEASLAAAGPLWVAVRAAFFGHVLASAVGAVAAAFDGGGLKAAALGA